MSENSNNQAVKLKLRDEAASVVASIFDLTPRAVRMVINGETTNEPVLEAVITYREGKNKLIQEIEKLVPF
jgi:hypothetical protein